MNFQKYIPFPPVQLDNRQWPNKTISKAPIWASVDLRDGNQSLITPMDIDQKVEFFKLLCQLGFKEIEIGFPSASEVEFEFCRKLIDENMIPADVSIQVLVQARQHLIERTFEALAGTTQAIVHFYNSTSTLQREVVFGKSKEEIKAIAVSGAQLVKDYADKTPGDFRFEYSPESFSQTELDYALEVCEAVMEVVGATEQNPIILNLPGTVESSTANVHADQIEWFCTHLKDRKSAIISLHTHNDRGTGVAACELGLMAGADRVEGTLFGNGERTGNLDIVNMALNMFTQGVDPLLDLSDINHIKNVYMRCTGMDIHDRHPYVGDLVYTAFSGSHQDAINKGIKALRKNKSTIWAVPYLPIDPKDVGRCYESIIRINSQSGKGGVAYIMDTEFGFEMPKAMHVDFGHVVQKFTEQSAHEVTPEQIMTKFSETYLDSKTPYELKTCALNEVNDASGSDSSVTATVSHFGELVEITGKGNGPIAAFVDAFDSQFNVKYTIKTYDEHAIEQGADSKAAAYISIIGGKLFNETFGVAVDSSIAVASIKAFISAVNRLELLSK